MYFYIKVALMYFHSVLYTVKLHRLVISKMVNDLQMTRGTLQTKLVGEVFSLWTLSNVCLFKEGEVCTAFR